MTTEAPFSPTLPERSFGAGRRLQVQRQSERSVSHAADLPLAPVQRFAAEPAAEPSVPVGESTSDVVQRGWLESSSSPTEVAPSPVAAVSPAVPGQGIGPVGPPSANMMPPESDMDELANKLYDRIRTRLKTELLVSRERAGMLTDWR
jgi:hypothetical protein